MVHLTHFVIKLFDLCTGSGEYSQKLAMSQNLVSLLSKLTDLAHFGPKFDPILVQLTHFVTGLSSNNIMYALVVVTILKNLQ